MSLSEFGELQPCVSYCDVEDVEKEVRHDSIEAAPTN